MSIVCIARPVRLIRLVLPVHSPRISSRGIGRGIERCSVVEVVDRFILECESRDKARRGRPFRAIDRSSLPATKTEKAAEEQQSGKTDDAERDANTKANLLVPREPTTFC